MQYEPDWYDLGRAASSPDPELKEKLDLFGQFVGDWDILEDRFYNEDGSEKSPKRGIALAVDS
jgi:hypothetical protein